jgi:hypothetical protein
MKRKTNLKTNPRPPSGPSTGKMSVPWSLYICSTAKMAMPQNRTVGRHNPAVKALLSARIHAANNREDRS